MSIIVRRPYDYKVKVGSRYGQRRTKRSLFHMSAAGMTGEEKKKPWSKWSFRHRPNGLGL